MTKVRTMTGTVSELFQNCDNWGAKEWFERLVDAIKRQDECVLAKDEIGFETYKHIAASSAMCLVREHADEVFAALTASASEPAPCPACNGKGYECDWVGLEMKPVQVDCSACGGTGTKPVPMSPEEHRLEHLKQMATYSGPIVSFECREPYYLASCDHCGWVGSSELCGTDSFGDDSDVYCPRCHASGADCGKVAEAFASPVPASEPEPVAGMPAYGRMPFEELGRDVREATTGVRKDHDFGDEYPGNVMVGPINFNSLNRIVSKYASISNPVPTPDVAVEALLDTRPAFWKHKRAHGHQYAVKQLHFPSKDAGLQWIEEYHPQQKPDALAGWADEAPFFDTNIWADIEPAALSAALSHPAGQKVAADIGDAVLAWMVKYDLLDGGNEYHVADVITVLNDLAPSAHPADGWRLVPVEPTDAEIEAGCRAMHEAQGTGEADDPLHSPYQNSWDEPDSVRWKQWDETVRAVRSAMLPAAPAAKPEGE